MKQVRFVVGDLVIVRGGHLWDKSCQWLARFDTFKPLLGLSRGKVCNFKHLQRNGRRGRKWLKDGKWLEQSFKECPAGSFRQAFCALLGCTEWLTSNMALIISGPAGNPLMAAADKIKAKSLHLALTAPTDEPHSSSWLLQSILGAWHTPGDHRRAPRSVGATFLDKPWAMCVRSESNIIRTIKSTSPQCSI